ncbi:MAG TPA: DNA repair protein RecN [Fibrobacteraceae bacterium]|nr:DNA repair protein RecN [Fibrobacteraceae bacterium]
MLKQLSIRDFTLIAQCDISFGPGFTAITGETGAGKSVLLKAIRLICGEKSTATMVRAQAEKATIEATFDISKNDPLKKILDSLEIDYDDELIIQREITESGKSRARVNGSVINLNDLQTLGESLIQMHGQSEQILLRDVRTHGQMLDDFCSNQPLLEKYTSLFSEWNQKKAQMEALKERAQNLAAQKDFLKFQFEELSKAHLKAGEEEELESLTSQASKGETERRFLEDMNRILESENGLRDQLRSFSAKMKQLALKIPRYGESLVLFQEVLDPLESFLKDFSSISPATEVSPAELDKANARLALIQKLKRKYRTDIDGLIALTNTRKEELESLDNLDADLEEISHQIKKIEIELNDVAQTLSEKRIAGATKLDTSVESILHELGMPGARFKTSILRTVLHATGFDKVEFMLAPNTGEGEKSLQKAVSGGELSRVLLAFKSVMAELDTTPLLIFDEVDSGISGEIGNQIGVALQKLGKHHQVLTITHLHQVASRAKGQLAVKKEEIDKRTYTHIFNLDYDSRILELSRMLGDEKSKTVQEHAKQLLEVQL